MHGSGSAPRGPRNGSYKHGGFTEEAIALRREVAALLKSIRRAEYATRGELLEVVVGAAARSSFGIDLPTLKLALAKVQRRQQGSAEEFTQVELDALSAWMGLQLAAQGKMTRAEVSERNKAAWLAGDRSKWGGDIRKRDRRRGWRNYGR